MIAHLCIIFSILSLAYSGACPTTFPANNNALTTADEFHTVSGALAGSITPSSLACTTSGTNGAYNYGQINLGYATSSASAGNVCARVFGAAPAGIAAQGTFVFNAAGEFVKADGTTLSSGAGDEGFSSIAYYAGVQSMWLVGQDLPVSATTVSINTGFTLYCYDASYTTTYCKWDGGLTDADATADLAATAMNYLATPTKGETGCRFTVTPSSAMTVEMTSTGSPMIGCASQTDSTTWATFSVTSATTTSFQDSLKVHIENSS